MCAKFNKIIVPVDGSKNSLRGLDLAIDLAKISKGEVTGYYVFHLPLVAGIKYTKHMRDDAQDKAAQAVGPAMQRADKAGVSFKYKTGGGNTGEQIVKIAESGDYDLVVIGARGITGAKEKFLGSVSNYVAHKCKKPVMIVK